MEVIHSKGFKKSYQKLSKELRGSVDEVLEIFQANPFDSKLRNHELKGNMIGMRVFSAKHDLRIVYREEGNHAIVYLIKTGSHNQVY